MTSEAISHLVDVVDHRSLELPQAIILHQVPAVGGVRFLSNMFQVGIQFATIGGNIRWYLLVSFLLVALVREVCSNRTGVISKASVVRRRLDAGADHKYFVSLRTNTSFKKFLN